MKAHIRKLGIITRAEERDLASIFLIDAWMGRAIMSMYRNHFEFHILFLPAMVQRGMFLKARSNIAFDRQMVWVSHNQDS